MHLLGCCSFQRILSVFSRFLMMEPALCLNSSSHNKNFGFDFCEFEYFKSFCNWLALLIMFCLGLKVLCCYGKGLLVRLLYEIIGKSNYLSNWFCSADDIACKNGAFRFLEDSISESDEDDGGGGGGGGSKEDIPALKRLVRIERDRANAAYLELEKERTAAASAAEEAMAMILRLQNEKSSIEMEGNQYRRLAEQKQLYDQEVIQCLRWIVLKHESDRSLIESQLNLCKCRLKQFMNVEKGDQKDDRIDQSLLLTHSCCSDIEDMLVSSLEMDSAFM